MAVREEAATRPGPGWIHLLRSVAVPCPRYARGDRVYRMQRHEQRTCLSLSTLYYSLFGGDSMLESLVNLSLDTSLSLLFLCTASTDDPLGLSEVGSDGL